jgi:hypothetical protein
VAVIAAGAAVTLLLGLLPGPAGLLVAASVLPGAVRGTFTLTEATLVADYWGLAGTRSSTACSTPRSPPPQLAPSARAAIAAAGSYPSPFAILAGTAAAGAGLAAAAPSPTRQRGGSGGGGQTGREAPDAVS